MPENDLSSGAPVPDPGRTVTDGFGGGWAMCARPDCGLQVVRPGKVQCWCDSTDGPLKSAPMGLADAERYVRMHLPPGAPADGDDRALAAFVAEYDRRRAAEIDELRAENARLHAALDAADRPVLDGAHALALGSIARDIGLTAEASGALVALTVADRIEELERLRGQRDAAIALHERREAASAAGGSTVWCERCSARKGEIVSWPCADARALGVEEDTRG